ncbi:aminotransferase class I/II-fold pyridoxal phosphate-dependent enzyme [Halobacillus shinanisalinarum]|uniref:Aminotransferase class I/II-fold pyridoxal phosphate-dependent enzyme n=1 Tax=Halobacillus shinanisalinarum TaxID=2932258 RepID=A0ABY4GWM1_9BACI|nr:aminotransferase class I/II-fold pyridoxal phosphate-dependent enzyme [Halobacillus shinanisalinarum]UOQ92401.1 aminotransferase class I/II-fold pyridoxal phosphate-dependent enzyme [Halobacillus shinanisalinarum]
MVFKATTHQEQLHSTMDHSAAPLYEALCLYERSQRTSLHVPGHKDGRVFDEEALGRFSSILKIDATESVGIDGLHHPTNFIAEAQTLAADAFGADHTFFLVGGSTIGNIGVALTLCSPGDKIIVQRNMHKSVFHGLMVAGAHPIFIAPSMEPTTKVAKVSDLSFIEKALKENPDVKGVWITNPNYYGMSQDITSLANACHQAGVPLVVDEAHGPHFGQAAEVPPSALSQGADLVVQSTHKMLTAMTMASMLHVKGNMVFRERLAQVLGMIQSTSPSYPLLASLDLARRYLVTKGRAQIKETVKRLDTKRAALASELQALSIWEGSQQVDHRDPLKWIISSKNDAVSGFQLLDMFYELDCTAEICDPRNVGFLFSIDEREEDIEKVVRKIKEMDEKLQKMAVPDPPDKSDMVLFEEEGTLYKPALSLHEAFHKPRKRAALQEAIGAICGEMVLPYPPGIPLLTPGEKITANHVKTIRQLKEMGAYFQGPSDETMKSLYVLC